MLSMQPASMKRRIAGEAARLLRSGGRYAIHELCLTPESIPPERRRRIEADLAMEIHVGVRPLTTSEWADLLDQAGFTPESVLHAPMHLLEPMRLISDEGVAGTLRFLWNAVRQPEARRRLLAMRRVFRRHRRHLGAVSLIARKRG